MDSTRDLKRGADGALCPQPNQYDHRYGRYGDSYSDFSGTGAIIRQVAPKYLKLVTSTSFSSFMVIPHLSCSSCSPWSSNFPS
ncbi:hypothetical protein DPMN_155626 [Dreissena polymorpha]|uniref:Uncharacterized protein n=1 Tax=Dreissena polymorpha TaxID=45954 RepID=A0A9D4FPR6_DREPO|nr:hypothetical protein DPMN_155626 [Dreissena polymorpha]